MAGLAISALLAAGAAAGWAAPGGARPAPGPQPPTGGAATGWHSDLSAGSYEVTLLTGDEVTVHVADDGSTRLVLTPDRRADGSSPVLQWYTTGEGLYVVPEDAEPYLDDELLDRTLFDVEYLAANDYGDRLPLIVQYGAGRSPAAAGRSGRALATGADPVPLPSVNGAAIEVDDGDTAAFWATLREASAPDGQAGPPGRAAAGADAPTTTAEGGVALPEGIARIWLDRVVRPTLAESVPQIGAPQAWQDGVDGAGVRVAVLDTGIDADHPDLAGRVSASANFVGDGPAVDGHGHGTHVASTVAGTGSPHRGVAPGAELLVGKVCTDDLLVGKVCTDDGSCPASAVIAGMEWAALEQGAEVVNLSLGGCCSDGTDPMSQALNQLTATTGTLFVVAAGNDGPTPSSVGSPGSADAALTVGSVNKSDQLASSSSRGPRVGDSALKPEITAPGVAIVAARAAGTGMGTPVDDLYTRASGTSMATPHVAGAAALLAQQHPQWDAEQLKAALVATAQDVGYTVYQQGAGRVDVDRAVHQQLQVSPAKADFGFEPFPPAGPARTRQLTYRNPTDEPVTLQLQAALHGPGGAPAPADTLSLDTSSLTVPAGDSATVTVTLDHTALPAGIYSGTVLAQSGATRLTSPVGLVVGEQQHRVSITLTPRACDNGVHCTDGYSSFNSDRVRLWLLDDDPGGTATATGLPRPASPVSLPAPPAVDGDPITLHTYLPTGHYALRWEPWWIDSDTNRRQYGWLWQPDLTVTGPTELHLNADDAVKVAFDVPHPTGDSIVANFQHIRVSPDATHGVYTGGTTAYGHGNNWSLPTEPVSYGTFSVRHQDVLAAPQLTMSVDGPTPTTLHPIQSGYRPGDHPHDAVPVRFPAGTRSLPVVDAGYGGEEDFAGLSAAGKLVLIRKEPRPGVFCAVTRPQLEQAQAAGAAGVLLHAGTCIVPIQIYLNPSNSEKPPIPYAALPSAEADQLAERLADGPVSITLTSTPTSPYTYYLDDKEVGQVPDSLHYRYEAEDLATVDAHYHAARDGWVSQTRFSWHPGDMMQVGQPYDFSTPMLMTEYWGRLDPDVRHQREAVSDVMRGLEAPLTRMDIFTAPGRLTEHWGSDPLVPGAVTAPVAPTSSPPVCAGCRQDDWLWPHTYLTTGDPVYEAGLIGFQLPVSRGPEGPWDGLRLYRDGQEVPLVPLLGLIPKFDLPAEPGRYRLTMDLAGAGDESWTSWEFDSGPLSDGESVGGDHACFMQRLLMQRLLPPGSPEPPCRPESLIFLRYHDLDLDLRNQSPAPGAHRFFVTAYRQPGQPVAAPVAGLRLWASFDDGQHWRGATVQPVGDGRFRVTVVHPPGQRLAGETVSLRVEAWDTAGSRVEQIVPDAYRLAARHPGGQVAGLDTVSPRQPG